MLYPGLVGVLPPLLLLFWGVIICFGLLGSFTPPKRKYPKGVTLGVCICMCFWLLCVFVCLRPVHMCFNFCLLSFHNTTIKKKKLLHLRPVLLVVSGLNFMPSLAVGSNKLQIMAQLRVTYLN